MTYYYYYLTVLSVWKRTVHQDEFCLILLEVGGVGGAHGLVKRRRMLPEERVLRKEVMRVDVPFLFAVRPCRLAPSQLASRRV